MKKILVPCDFSEPALEAFQFAISIASKNEGSITVLKIVDFPVMYESTFGLPISTFSTSLQSELEADARKKYERLVKKYSKGFTNIRFLFALGSTSIMIRDFINDKKFDLVIMGTHGTSGMAEFFVGSNTEKIVRFSKSPVFAIRKAVPITSIKNIVFPTNLQRDQSDFIRKLKTLQEFFNAKLHILFVNTPFSFVRDSELEDYAKHCKFTNYTLSIRNDRYEPEGIIAFAKDVKADMLAMPTHGRKGLSHLISGSITEDVVNHIECPVWTYVIKEM